VSSDVDQLAEELAKLAVESRHTKSAAIGAAVAGAAVGGAGLALVDYLVNKKKSDVVRSAAIGAVLGGAGGFGLGRMADRGDGKGIVAGAKRMATDLKNNAEARIKGADGQEYNASDMGLDKSTKKYSLPVQIGNAIFYGLSQAGSGTLGGAAVQAGLKGFSLSRYGGGLIRSPKLGYQAIIDAAAGTGETGGKEGKVRIGSANQVAADTRHQRRSDADTTHANARHLAGNDEDLLRRVDARRDVAHQTAQSQFETDVRNIRRNRRNVSLTGWGALTGGIGLDVFRAYNNRHSLPTPASPATPDTHHLYPATPSVSPEVIQAALSKGLRPSQPGNALDAWAGSALPQPDPTTNMAAW
jgi:hypothetical protein